MEVDTNIAEMLEQAGEGEEIILEHGEDCEDGEYEEEIVEIIEEIEEVEEDDEVQEIEEVEEDDEEQHIENVEQDEEIQEEEVQHKNVSHESDSTHNSYIKRDYKEKQTTQSIEQEKSSNQVCYDASADWEDEEIEREQHNFTENTEVLAEDYNTYIAYENEEGAEDHENEEDQVEYEHDVNQERNENIDNNQHEIVQNSENNLVYTVLGSKKQVISHNDQTNLEFVEVQRYRDDSMPEDGTIFYAVNNGDGTYVEAVDEDGQQYQYVSGVPMEQENQEWEASNQSTEQHQDQEQTEQDQIFLHEDEDGQLYFKNEHGQLQPVYLTPDGNYAIAENSSDEQDSQEDVNQIREEQVDTDNYVLPDLDLKPYSSKKRSRHQVEDDDDTVTISLIISEDEHGQKRTQVIIPTQPEEKCDLCNKTFKTSLQLLKHNRLKHAREEDITTRNFPCDLCPKRFTDQNSLARHRKTHTEARPFQCLECHKSFPTANTLRKHLSLHNPNSHPLPCIYCGRRFLDRTSLMKHEQSHLGGEKRSDLRQKCFENLDDISKKNLEPDRKYDCEVCGREFNRLTNLQRHMMVHQQQGESEEILSCNVCGITYKFSSSLTRHMVTTHMNPEKLRQQAEEQRRKRETNYRRYMENRKTYETQLPKRPCRRSGGRMDDQDDEVD